MRCCPLPGRHPVPDDRRTDEELLSSRNDPANAAFGEFYARYERPMLAYFMRRVRSAEVAADLTAETFAQALASRGRFRRHGPAVAWLFGIARNVLAKSARRGQVEDRGRRRLGLAELVLDDESVRLIDAMASDSAVAEALSALSPEQREAVHARVLDEDSYEEIAQRLRCSPGVVRQRVSRGLARLRAQLEEQA